MRRVVPKTVYFKVSVWLAVLFVVTVAASRIDLGAWNVALALAISTAKAALIVLFFMHVRYGSPLVRLFAMSGVLWLLILFVFIAADVVTRDRRASPQLESATDEHGLTQIVKWVAGDE